MDWHHRALNNSFIWCSVIYTPSPHSHNPTDRSKSKNKGLNIWPWPTNVSLWLVKIQRFKRIGRKRDAIKELTRMTSFITYSKYMYFLALQRHAVETLPKYRVTSGKYLFTVSSCVTAPSLSCLSVHCRCGVTLEKPLKKPVASQAKRHNVTRI